MRITSILTAITLTLGASTAYAACSTPSDNRMPAGNIPILKMSAGSGSFGAAPSTDVPTGGEMYFDVGLSEMIWCDGTNWKRLDGTQAFNESALTAKVEEVATVAEEAKIAADGAGGSGIDPNDPLVVKTWSFPKHCMQATAGCTGTLFKEGQLIKDRKCSSDPSSVKVTDSCIVPRSKDISLKNIYVYPNN